MTAADDAQKFGGPWTLIKTDSVAGYLPAFTTALKHQRFRLVYIDAFAGSGAFTFDQSTAPLLDDDAVQRAHTGSARNALAVSPPFDELVFIDEKARNVRALETLVQGRSDARVIRHDANVAIAELCAPELWRPRGRRGVIFLDPFGLNAHWSSLEAIASTRALDLWYLFSLAGLYRNAPLSIDALDSDKRDAVTRALGVANWIDDFYGEPSPPRQGSLFNAPVPAASAVRTLTVDGMERYVTRRLETIFPYVAAPRRLLGPTGAPLFSLFFAVSNPDPPARNVAAKIAEHILHST